MNNPINTTMNLKEWNMIILLSILWGGSFFFVEVIIAELPTLTVVFLRVALAAVALWVFVFATGLKIPTTPKAWLAFLIVGLLNNVIPFWLIIGGQIYITAGLSSILNATTPLFAIVVAGILLADERPTYLKIIGVVIGFFGTVVMIGPSALEGLNKDVIAQIAILGAALSYAFSSVYGRRFKVMNIDPTMVATGQVTTSSLILMPVVLLIDQPFSLAFPSTQVVASVLALAILSTAVAYVLYFRILGSAGAVNSLLVTFLVPISAILLGTLILGESLELIHLLGMALIALGLSVIDGRLWRFLKR